MLSIRTDNDPILKAPTADVLIKDIKAGCYNKLIQDMREILDTAPAVGLAAPQIGESIRLIVIIDKPEFIMHLSEDRRRQLEREPFEFTALFNPQYAATTDRSLVYFEGCLSSPGKMGAVERPGDILVSGLDASGQTVIFTASGWKARIICHEIDHLRGDLFQEKAFSRSIMTLEELKANQTLCRASSDELKELYRDI